MTGLLKLSQDGLVEGVTDLDDGGESATEAAKRRQSLSEGATKLGGVAADQRIGGIGTLKRKIGHEHRAFCSFIEAVFSGIIQSA